MGPGKTVHRVPRALLAGSVMLLALCGCGGRSKPAKFTKEQMETLPFPPRTELPSPSRGMVLSVGNETITVDEIIGPFSEALGRLGQEGSYEAFQSAVRPRLSVVVQDRITDALLHQRARKAAPERVEEALEKAVEQEVNRFVARYGHNYAEAQKVIAQMGLDWKGYREYLERLLLVQSYLHEEIKDDSPISHSELIEYYESVKDQRFSRPGEIQFRVIDIIGDRLAPEQVRGDSGETPQQAALRIAQELYDQLQAGADFAELARTHSHDHRAGLGGLWRPITPGVGSLAAPYDALEAQAETLSEGQVSRPFASGGHVFLVRVETKQIAGVQPFAQVQSIIEEEVRQLKQRRAYDRFIAKVIGQADIRNADRFVDFCVEEAYRRYGPAGDEAAVRTDGS